MNIDWPPDRWGCPDWRDHAAYPSEGDDLKDWQWKWEFLRRNNEFRDAYDPWFIGKAEGKFPPGTILWKIMRLHGMDYLPDPSSNAPDIQNPFTLIGGTILSPPNQLPPLKSLKLPMGIEEAVEIAKQYSTFEQKLLLVSEMKDLPFSIAVFDYSKPIKPQVKAVEEQLVEKQESRFPDLQQIRNRRENWPRHLRIIDAKDQKATHSEIYAHIAGEIAGSDEDALDYLYRTKTQPKALVSQWYKQAVEVIEKAARFL